MSLSIVAGRLAPNATPVARRQNGWERRTGRESGEAVAAVLTDNVSFDGASPRVGEVYNGVG